MQFGLVNNINFNGKIGYDDEISSKRREYIRSHLEGDTFQRADIFKYNMRLEEYELNKLIKSLTEKKFIVSDVNNRINSDIMKKLPLYNVCPIYGTNSYKGSTTGMTDGVCRQLKKAGIKRVITFLPFSGYNIENCEKNGLETHCYPVGSNFWNKEMFKNEDIIIRNAQNEWCYSGYEDEFKEILDSNLESWGYYKKSQIKEFVKFIQIMQKENVYVGCACAEGRTESMLLLNHFFNPKAAKTKFRIPYNDEDIGRRIMNLYNNLTSEDKAKMGWDEEFDRGFIEKVNKQLIKYL